MVIDVNTHSVSRAYTASGCLLLIGVACVVAPLITPDEFKLSTALWAGGFFLLPMLITLAMHKKLAQPRTLTIDRAGVRWHDGRYRVSFAVGWHELATVAINAHVATSPDPTDQAAKTAASGVMKGPRGLVLLDLYPADPGFTARHPEMAAQWEKHGARGAYRLALGASLHAVPEIDRGLTQFAAHRYRGAQRL